ncbi:hypothetical protein FI667_g13258, partial [Globisporangium splendens]
MAKTYTPKIGTLSLALSTRTDFKQKMDECKACGEVLRSKKQAKDQNKTATSQREAARPCIDSAIIKVGLPLHVPG